MSTSRKQLLDPSSSLHSLSRWRIEIFAGLVTAFALIPESTSFAIATEVGPEVGMFTRHSLCDSNFFYRMQPAMTSGAAGSVALVLALVVQSYGKIISFSPWSWED